jgi:hypothetical protein
VSMPTLLIPTVFPPRFTNYPYRLMQDRRGSESGRRDVRRERRTFRIGSPVLGGTQPGHRMTGEHLSFSANPRRIGALGSCMIGGGRPVHLSLNRWFSRLLHSNEAPTTGRRSRQLEHGMVRTVGRSPFLLPKSRTGMGAAAPPAGSYLFPEAPEPRSRAFDAGGSRHGEMTSQGTADGRFTRAIQQRNLFAAEMPLVRPVSVLSGGRKRQSTSSSRLRAGRSRRPMTRTPTLSVQVLTKSLSVASKWLAPFQELRLDSGWGRGSGIRGEEGLTSAREGGGGGWERGLSLPVAHWR